MPAPLSPQEIAQARQTAWFEWIWLATVVVAGIVVASLLQRNRRGFAMATAGLVGLYVLSRWYFAPSNYRELFGALFDEGARAGQLLLITTAPGAFSAFVYYYVLGPVVLVALALWSMQQDLRRAPE